MTVFSSIWGGGGINLDGVTEGNIPMATGGEFVDSPAAYDGEDFTITVGSDTGDTINLTGNALVFNQDGTSNNIFRIITDETANYRYAMRITTGTGDYGLFCDGDLHIAALDIDGGIAKMGELRYFMDGSLGNSLFLSSLKSEFIDDTEAAFTTRLSVLVTDYAYTNREVMRFDADGTEAKIGFFGSAAVGKQAHVSDPTDLATSITAISAIIDILEAYGLSATS
jgi:hypothetical protein